MAITFVAAGAFASASAGVNNIAVPTGSQLGDLMIMLTESANETISTPTTSVGTWTQIGDQTVQAVGTAAGAGATRLAVWYKWWETGQTVSAVADSGDHTCAQIVSYRGVDVQNPFNTSSGGAVAADTADVTLPAVTTTTPNSMILFCVANDRDLASTTNYNSLTNANLSSINERIDQTIATQQGGGLCLYDAMSASCQNIGTSTLAKSTAYSAAAAYLTLALRPKRRLASIS